MTCKLDMAPYYAEHGSLMRTHTLDRDQLWRQIGWIGLATNHVWSLDDPGWKTDPAGVAPLWLLVDNDPTTPHEPPERPQTAADRPGVLPEATGPQRPAEGHQ